MTPVEKKQGEAFKNVHPPEGRFATEKKPDAQYQMTFTESKPCSQSTGWLGNVEVVAPGVSFACLYGAHGRLFVYDGREDVWICIDAMSMKVEDKWVRILGEAPEKPWVNTSHPPDGEFEVGGCCWGKYGIGVKDSLIQGEKAETAEVIIPGVCHIPYWHGHGSTFVYNAQTDKWIEVHAAGHTGQNMIPMRINNHWARVGAKYQSK